MSDQEGVIAWSLKAPSKKVAQKKRASKLGVFS